MKEPKSKSRSKKKLEKAIYFEHFAPGAKTVELAGTFNDWNPSKTPLSKDSDGRWKVTLELSSGYYEYRFLVDDNWQNDQRPVECVPNAFGTWNCVLRIH